MFAGILPEFSGLKNVDFYTGGHNRIFRFCYVKELIDSDELRTFQEVAETEIPLVGNEDNSVVFWYGVGIPDVTACRVDLFSFVMKMDISDSLTLQLSGENCKITRLSYNFKITYYDSGKRFYFTAFEMARIFENALTIRPFNWKGD